MYVFLSILITKQGITVTLYIKKPCYFYTGWLDDIGLPQYKDPFHDGRVDGRMLQYLTVVNIFVNL